ncbi:MAG: cardiolipin synthase [Thermoanaerobaculia bacterium]
MNRDPQTSSVWTWRGTTYIRMPIVMFVGLILALAAMTILFWSVKRRTDPKLQVGDHGELQTLMPSIVGLTGSSLEEGNGVQVLQNGDGFFPPVLADIAAARHSIHLETFIWYDSAIARRLAEALAAKAQQGVSVRVLVDGSGGRQLDDEERAMLDRAGARVAHFHPFRISNLGRLNNRDHRKLIIIDGRIAYVGGHGIADEWTGNAQDREHFRDTALRITGPAVNQLQGAFAENWIEETGEIPAGDEYFPHLPPSGTSKVHVAYASPTGSVSSVEILHYLAIKSAKREILIANPYMVPDPEAIEALAEAVKRGVDVRVLVPSDDATDSPLVQHASHHHFGSLLQRGVKIWEYEKTLLHQKVMVVDGLWSCVGSTNFDERSFELNDEVSVGVLDAAVAQQLRAAFAADLQHAKQRHFEEWSNRPIRHRLLDGLAYLGESQM